MSELTVAQEIVKIQDAVKALPGTAELDLICDSGCEDVTVEIPRVEGVPVFHNDVVSRTWALVEHTRYDHVSPRDILVRQTTRLKY